MFQRIGAFVMYIVGYVGLSQIMLTAFESYHLEERAFFLVAGMIGIVIPFVIGGLLSGIAKATARELLWPFLCGPIALNVVACLSHDLPFGWLAENQLWLIPMTVSEMAFALAGAWSAAQLLRSRQGS